LAAVLHIGRRVRIFLDTVLAVMLQATVGLRIANGAAMAV
jgi:hypothetical protein